MNTEDLLASAAKKKLQRIHNRFEQRRQQLVERVNEGSPAGSPRHGSVSQSPTGSPRQPSLGAALKSNSPTKLQQAVDKAAKSAVAQTVKTMNPLKPRLEDVARMFLQDAGEKSSGRPLLQTEEAFVRDSAVASNTVQKVRDMYRDVEGAIVKRVQAIEHRRAQIESQQTSSSELVEHVTYSEYQKYMRKRGFLRDDREEVPEGNLIPILAVLQGQAESIGFLRSQKKVVRIGDFVVELDPNDPLFARYDEDTRREDEAKLMEMKLYRGGRFKDANVQTDVRNDDATDAELAYVYQKLDECQSVIEAVSKAKLEAELFCETALSRVVALRESATKMYDTLETGQATLSRLTAEAMAQNERLWRRLEAIAADQADERAKRSVQRTFTQQIDRLNRMVASLKQMLEVSELGQMQLVDDYHYHDKVHDKLMDDLRKQVIPKGVKDELNRCLLFVDTTVARETESGGAVHAQCRATLEAKCDVFASSRLTAADGGQPLTLVVPPKWKSSFLLSMESAFASFDEIGTQLIRNVVEMMLNPHNPPLVAERVKDVREIVMELRHALQHVTNDMADAALEAISEDQAALKREIFRLSGEMDRAALAHQEALRKQAEELSMQFKEKMSGTMSIEQFEREKTKAVNREKERFLQQLGKDIPFPVVTCPSFDSGKAAYSVPKAILSQYAQPQDILHVASAYITELILEQSQMCSRLNQPPPPRLANASVALQLISLAQNRVTNNEGLIDGVAAVMTDVEGAADVVVPPQTPTTLLTDPNFNTKNATEIAEAWWTTAGVGAGSRAETPGLMSQSLSGTFGSMSYLHKHTATATAEDGLFQKGTQLAADILKGAPSFTKAHLAITTQLNRVANAPESSVAATVTTAKERAEKLRAEGIIKPRAQSPESMSSLGKDSPRKQAKKGGGNAKGPAAAQFSESPAAVTLPAITVPTMVDRRRFVDRATSPVAGLYQTAVPNQVQTRVVIKKVVDPSLSGERLTRVQLDERAARRAREELATTLRQQYIELHAALEYLRISVLAVIDDPSEQDPYIALRERTRSLANIETISGDVSKMFAFQIREDREILEKVTAMLLACCDDGDDTQRPSALEKARVRYRVKAPKLGFKSRVRLFLSPGVDVGIMCDLIGGKEAVLTSAEAIDYAVHRDMRIWSNTRKMLHEAARRQFADGHKTVMSGDQSLLPVVNPSGPVAGNASLPPIQLRQDRGRSSTITPSKAAAQIGSLAETGQHRCNTRVSWNETLEPVTPLDEPFGDTVPSQLPAVGSSTPPLVVPLDLGAIAVRRLVANDQLPPTSSRTPPPSLSRGYLPTMDSSPAMAAYRHGKQVERQDAQRRPSSITFGERY